MLHCARNIEHGHAAQNIISIYKSGLKEFVLNINKSAAKKALLTIEGMYAADIEEEKVLELISNKLKVILDEYIAKKLITKTKGIKNTATKTKDIKNTATKTKGIKKLSTKPSESQK